MRNFSDINAGTSIIILKAATLPPADINFVAPNPDNEAECGLAPPILLRYWQAALCSEGFIMGITIAVLTLGLITMLLATAQYTAN